MWLLFDVDGSIPGTKPASFLPVKRTSVKLPSSFWLKDYSALGMTQAIIKV